MNQYNKDAEILRKILNEDVDESHNKVNELRIEIYDEIRKSDDDMDCDLVDENIKSLLMLNNQKYEYSDKANVTKTIWEKVERAEQPTAQAQKVVRHKLLSRVAMALCLTVFIFAGANVYVAEATGNSIIDRIVEMGKRSIIFNFHNTDSAQVVLNETLYENMKQTCKNYNITPLLPKSLPQDFKIISVDEQNSPIRKQVSIQLGNAKQVFIIEVRQYFDQTDIPNLQTPNATDLQKIAVNGKEVYISKAGDKYISIFNDGSYVYDISSTLNLDQTTAIMKSFN